MHYVEMCAAMCVGFVIGDAIFFAPVGLAGYSKTFTELPVLSVLVVTMSMTVPMTASMLYRGMPRRIVAEMSASMPVLAIALLCLGWSGAIPMSAMAPAQRGLMMPAMLVPMLVRLDFYPGRAYHTTQACSIREGGDRPLLMLLVDDLVGRLGDALRSPWARPWVHAAVS